MRSVSWSLRASLASLVVLAGAAAAQAQTTGVDRSFKAVSKNCSGVQWSEEALETYPKIASACQGVEERNGKTYVKFSGTVERNIERGKQIEIKFRDGAKLKLAPPENLALFVNDRKTSVRDLQRGDSLTFYVPEDQFSAHFAQDEQPTATTEFVAASIEQEPAITDAQPERSASLPSTASQQPLLMLGGLLCVALGFVLTLMRLRRQGP